MLLNSGFACCCQTHWHCSIWSEEGMSIVSVTIQFMRGAKCRLMLNVTQCVVARAGASVVRCGHQWHCSLFTMANTIAQLLHMTNIELVAASA